ncbi:chromosome partitioning protein ParA [Vibrio mangrovi]|uniref:Chromosome partitioning protein ParA n=1 Tax=Vibrio mangrovi TaxID=474394 RepID=A0A1Y6IW21_9VIBR|nr:chromosome partitioning protein ParA [Vibrio mangrovi]MDW6004729.1 chromosome partitioning protein ParA [Vibrio mangrovi]SMS01020.1 hypothetical protein VIM7927_02297 [Vibrio mangrovi]
MGNESSMQGISQREFTAFRDEMRECMQQQTELMRQMVELQIKHNNLESQFRRHDKEIEALESRVLPLEQKQGGTDVKTQYHSKVVWLLLSFLAALAGYAIRNG